MGNRTSNSTSHSPQYGKIVLVLHSHLPYYRHHGMWPFGEENLYECMAETYIPLLDALLELQAEGIRANITIGVTPILCEQLADPHLQEGFITFLDQRIKAATEDTQRYPNDTTPHSEHLAFLAQWYLDHYQGLKDRFTSTYGRNLLPWFKRLQDDGCVELITSGATHGFLPLLGQDEAVDFQIKVGVETYKHHFGRAPKGIWLPECAYRPEFPENSYFLFNGGKHPARPGIDAFLAANGLEYFCTEFHAIEGSTSTGFRRVIGLYGHIEYIPLPARPATGLTTYEAYWLSQYPVAVMGRNERASFQVWSADHGYPGDGLYREFHRKDCESGLHYWRLTSKEAGMGDKMLYDPILAFNQTKMQAEHYRDLCAGLLGHHQYNTNEEGLIMVSFDTELFGHWWFEGVTWLKHFIKEVHNHPHLELATASNYLAKQPPKTAIDLPESTWGHGGHYWVWLNEQTEWVWPYIHHAEATMKDLVAQFGDTPDPLTQRILNHCARELLLLEGSDWPFLITTGQAKDYAFERFLAHKDAFWAVADMLLHGPVDTEKLLALEHQDNPFGFIDYRWLTEWQSKRPNPNTLRQPVAS